LVAGSISLAQTLLEHDLVDELRLMVYPVILGSGRRLFPESPRKVPLKLTESRALDNGVMIHTYQTMA
jgi:dihydrofolate reductase